jgi:hypothetical protein
MGATLNVDDTIIEGDLTLGVDVRILVPDAHTLRTGDLT